MDITNTITSVPGFKVSSVDAGLRKEPSPDLTLIVAEAPCTAAGVFTTNYVKAAPVLYDQERLAANPEGIRAVLINAQVANAVTGQEGLRNARQTAAWTARAIGATADDVLVMSTGVIGIQLPMDKMEPGIAAAAKALRADGWQEAARGIMTTDTKPKIAAVQSDGITILGIAKGAGMMAPHMATMLSAIVTDADISADLLHRALKRAVYHSFNRITVDGDMSTNDTVLLLASGVSDVRIADRTLEPFVKALRAVCEQLAKGIVHDAEGATRFIEIWVTSARSEDDAHQIANTIAISPLVKTAFYGGDANWGRIFMAAGRAGIAFDPARLSLWFGDLQLVDKGMPLAYDETQANALAASKEVKVTLDLGLGGADFVVWTCDLSHEYVTINGHYRT
ncbi:MAG TPA: bifunctional glutamate N-acetyltransferase/amino-acid acetyltransferase ArgJ [Aggregatilineales bacterium]|nr:bifunctional glutamate N-acetyltransferase/amino-acid acetyltransferase ArgJ [Aggregatilineales bacterium]